MRQACGRAGPGRQVGWVRVHTCHRAPVLGQDADHDHLHSVGSSLRGLLPSGRAGRCARACQHDSREAAGATSKACEHDPREAVGATSKACGHDPRKAAGAATAIACTSNSVPPVPSSGTLSSCTPPPTPRRPTCLHQRQRAAREVQQDVPDAPAHGGLAPLVEHHLGDVLDLHRCTPGGVALAVTGGPE